MLLVVDIGNTHITMGLYDGDNLFGSFRTATDKNKSSDEIGLFILDIFDHMKISVSDICDVVISSVVPPIMHSFLNAIKKYLKKEAYVVTANTDTGLVIKYDKPQDVGADRIVNAVAALSCYSAPMIIVDFGTATTFCVINKERQYVGGAIMPGIKISMEALFEKTAKLPRIEIEEPKNVIGSSTIESMQSGVYYGYVGSVDYITDKMKKELSCPDATVIATGGMARFIAKNSKAIDVTDSHLTLKGLREIYNKIKK